MNKLAIKNFAVTARVKLLEAIEQKAYELGITKLGIKEPEVYKDGFRVNDKFFKKYQMKQREKLIQKIQDKGFDQLVEEVAYTWFNRFIAIRFMEVNEYLPTGIRVLSSIDSNKVEPDAVSDVLTIADDLKLDLDVVYRLQDENNSEELFKYIFVKQCNKLGEIMPIMFEKIEDYTELLLPDKLLSEGSVVRDLILTIDELDWKEQVEIIGWLYQYYISEKKDQVFSDLKKNKKISKEDIPAATQLFTPKWIVQYMVENSLGRYWLETHPDEALQKKLKYFVEDAEQELKVKEQIIKIKNKEFSPEEIKILDPCMGSGHILVYAFDVLYKIYQNAGYSEREIPQLILEKNLYGLDIDDRAAQLAYFALLMKARSYNRRIFRNKLDVNVCSIQESNVISDEALSYFVGDTLERKDILGLIEDFRDAKEFGSIIKVNAINYNEFQKRLEEIGKTEPNDLMAFYIKDLLLEHMPKLIKQATILSEKYDIVVTNPPYMGSKGVNPTLLKYINNHYELTKSDMSTVMMERSMLFCKENGFMAMINIPSWMFLSTYEKYRDLIIESYTIQNMLHFGRGVFGSDFGTTAFVFRNKYIENFKGCYRKLFLRQGAVDDVNTKEKYFFSGINQFVNNQLSYKNIPGHPIAYWISPNMIEVFKKYQPLGNKHTLIQGLITADNNRFLRYWYEVSNKKIGFGVSSVDESKRIQKKWFPYTKGGEYRKWYGNNEYVVNWENDGYEIKNFVDSKGKQRSRPQNVQHYFKMGITWTVVSSASTAFRFLENGFIYSNSGQGIIIDNHEDAYKLIGFLNTKLVYEILNLLSPSIGFESGYISKIPYSTDNINDRIVTLVKENINISKGDWDSFEKSWDFKKHPILNFANKNDSLKKAYEKWESHTIKQFECVKKNEEELNKTFIKIFGLESVLNYEITDNDITIIKAERERDIKSFISYAVGCMFGRYSIDHEGLVLAGGDYNEENYVTYIPDQDNIIPITDDEYFEDDVLSRFIDFVRVTFGQSQIEENLDFIANSLTRKNNETSRQRIRRYFVKEFYKDHLQTYQKCPIYWLFDSGKNDGFKALIYLHRYDVGTVAKMRTDYLHTIQRKYEAEMSRLDLISEADVSTQEKTKAKKLKEKIQKQLLECQQYDQVVAHVANQKIEINQDDGVKVNYEKFQNIEVPQGEGKKPLKANLLSKI
ncbi:MULTISPECIES: BREX-1 system adenine-specific DNA-methyltransferase PglX [unclassified Mesobacillus]|uniref:BREX-1 system adenine-specific DNA-methyltransferase PglX n=1 Tax=unclassified Mesobacillus TaxID=2675270 RepID=UPI00203EBEF8|nr:MULTISPECIES: BREX-1 system adenine-specific DNA-methyltransferase PglX [unclassified Mesobacillus]MCM3122890.1 BREX-1 system adenine-specific DNA-methyltransferase PglX [Mesobacillus sp. MER 33]MCM3233627.1 BREX-1 system adenine-specific DNA-methyltransferase PglX [Mesobacillus sp. MER 48]